MDTKKSINYFAYGSNMPLARLQQRVPSAKVSGIYFVTGYDLRFHMVSHDNSAKCDAFYTGHESDCVWGVVFTMSISERGALDQAESLDVGYKDKWINVTNQQGEQLQALIYCAIPIDAAVKPYSWYVNHVLIGAEQNNLPEAYIEKIKSVEYIEDEQCDRALREYGIHQ